MSEKLKKFKDWFSEKWTKFKLWLSKILVKLFTWIADNPDKAATIAGMGIAGGKLALKYKRRHDEQYKYDRRVYDERTHTWWETRRKLTPHEKKIVEARSWNGELKSDVLAEMGLLKL